MKDINSNLLPNQPPDRLRLNRRLYIVLICFGISSVFWLLIALSRDYPSEMVIPVNYSNIPGKKVVVNDLPKSITVEIRTTGFRILSNHFKKSFEPIHIDVAGKMQRSYLSSGILALPTQSFLSDFSRQLGKEINITGFKPDSIVFNFKDKVTRLIPVQLSFKGTFQKQYDTTSAAEITPSVIEVSGPPSELAKTDFISTQLLVGNDLKSDLIAKVKLVKNKLLTYSTDEVQVRVPVEKFTEGMVDVEVHTINVTAGYSLKTFPETVKVRYVVPLSYYNKVIPSLFDGIVDATNLENTHPDKLPVQLMTKPSFVRTAYIDPEKVDYILRKQ